VGFKLYKSFAKYNRGYGFMACIFLIQVAWMLVNAFSNMWLAHWSERNLYEKELGKTDLPSNSEYLNVYVAVGIIYGTLAFVRALMIAYSSPKMSEVIHESMISNLLFSSLNEFFDRVPLGRIFNRLSKDLNSVDSNLPAYFSSTVVFTSFLATNLIIILLIAPIAVFLPMIVIYLVLCHLLRGFVLKPQRELTRLEGFTKSPIVSCFSEILQGVATIRSYNVKDMFFQKNCEKINENKKPIIARKAVEVWFTFRLTIVSFLINITSLTYILFFSVKNDNEVEAAANAGLLLMMSLAMDEIMYFLYVNMNTFENELISIERCESFMSLEPEGGYVQYLKNREELKIKSKERRLMKADGWPDRGRIDFENLKCRYRKNLDLVLRGLTVVFQGGHKIGVVGRTGSGKSTIMMCLLRILEATEGKIVIDGRDISQLSLDDLRSKITIILQDPCLFAGTIREVLLPPRRTWTRLASTPMNS
jgi:ABC-type multidrug transport system fused ATPase/permease subunit